MLFLVFLMTTLGLFALFLGGGLVAQGYLYQNPAERMPLRALAAAVLVSGFVTFWVWVDQRAPGRYDTFFNFSAETSSEFNEFEAVRWMGGGGKLNVDSAGNYTETTARFKRSSSAAKFREEGSGNEFVLQGHADGRTYLTGAIRVKGPDDPEPVRYGAMFNPAKPKENPEYAPARRFVEEKGSRYVEVHKLGTLFVPSTGTVMAALLLNFMLIVVWLAAFWPVLRFSLAHSLIFAGSLALLTMLAIMPVLFKQNRVPKAAPSAAVISREMNCGVIQTRSS